MFIGRVLELINILVVISEDGSGEMFLFCSIQLRASSNTMGVSNLGLSSKTQFAGWCQGRGLELEVGVGRVVERMGETGTVVEKVYVEEGNFCSAGLFGMGALMGQMFC